MRPSKCALCRVNETRRSPKDLRKRKKDIIFYNRHRRDWFQSVVRDIKNDPVHPTCFKWMIKSINKLNKINKTKNEKWEYIPIPKNPPLAPTRCALCKFYIIKRPKNNTLKKQKDLNFQRRDFRGWLETLVKNIKNNPVHSECVDWLVKDIAKLNEASDFEKIPTPQNPILEFDEDSDDHWTDEEVWTFYP